MSQISRKISNEQGRNFDTLLAISGTLINDKSFLRYLAPSGEFLHVSDHFSIGFYSPHDAVFLKKLFRREMNMEEGAELGYFIIKYVQRFDLSIHPLDINPPFDKPVIWYVPDGTPDFLMTDQKILEEMESNSIKHLDRLESDVVNSYNISNI